MAKVTESARLVFPDGDVARQAWDVLQLDESVDRSRWQWPGPRGTRAILYLGRDQAELDRVVEMLRKDAFPDLRVRAREPLRGDRDVEP